MLIEDTQHRALLQDVHLVQLHLVENDAGAAPGVIKLRGEFARLDVPTANGRVYPRKIIQRELGRLKEALARRSLFGHLDHPDQGGTKLGHTAMVITDLKIEGDVVVGEGEILGTSAGKELRAILAAGCRVGVSSRGYGSTREDSSGRAVVQDDFRLATYDVVADPADTHAYPDVIRESTEAPVLSEELLRVEIERARMDERAAVEQRLMSEQALNITDVLSVVRAEAEANAYQRMTADPRNAAPHRAIEAIKRILMPFIAGADELEVVQEQQVRIQELEAELKVAREREEASTAAQAKLHELAHRLGFTLYLEKTLRADPNRKLIEHLIGDVLGYTDLASLKAKVEDVRKKLSEKDAATEKLRKEYEDAQAKAKTEALRAEQAEEALRQERQRQSVSLYTEKQLLGDPQALRLRKLVEAASPATPAEVDKILKEGRTPSPNGDVRDRVRTGLRRGSAPKALDEERRRSRETAPPRGGYNNIDLDVHTFKKLIGLGP